MMIKDVRTYKVCYESINKEEDALAVRAGAKHPMEIVLTEIETDDGYVGIGESLSYGCADITKQTIDKIIRPLIINEDEERIEYLWNKIYRATLRYGRRGIIIGALSGVDIALWDILGKKAKKPLYKLLGGSSNMVRAYITGGYYAPGKGIKELQDEFLMYVKQGFKGVKVKIGALKIEDDINRVKAVKDVVGDETLIAVDANNVYSYDEALRMGKELEKIGIWFFEEPLQTDLIDLSAKLAQVLDVPIAGYETAFTRWEYYEIMKRGAVDIVQVDASFSGGISEFIKIAHIANVMGYPIIPHYSATAVSLVANLHVAAALGFEWIEYHLRPNKLRDELFKEKIEIENGYLKVPERPGLGFTIRDDAYEVFRCKD